MKLTARQAETVKPKEKPCKFVSNGAKMIASINTLYEHVLKGISP